MAPPAAPSRVEIGVAVAMIAFGVVVIVGSLQVGIGWGAEGPKSGFFPFYLGLDRSSRRALLNLVRGATRKAAASSSPTGRSSRQVLQVVMPTTIYVVAIPWIGIYLASAAADRVLHALARPLRLGCAPRSSIGVPVATYLMFEKWFLVPLPKGPIEDFLGSRPSTQSAVKARGERHGRDRQSVSRLRRRAASRTTCC